MNRLNRFLEAKIMPLVLAFGCGMMVGDTSASIRMRDQLPQAEARGAAIAQMAGCRPQTGEN